MKALSMSLARRRLKAPGYVASGAYFVGLAAIYLYLFQPFWSLPRATALFLLAVVVLFMAVAMRKKAFVIRALQLGVPAVFITLGWLLWLSALPGNREAPLEDVAPLYDNPETRGAVLAGFKTNGTWKLSVEQVEGIKAAHKLP